MRTHINRDGNRFHRKSLIAASAALGLMSSANLSAATQTTLDVAFTKIADYATIIPERGATFDDLGAPSISNGWVAFWGNDFVTQPTNLNVDGIYQYNLSTAQLTRIADETTEMPGQPGVTFKQFEKDVSISGGNVAFVGSRFTGSTNKGAYKWTSQQLSLVADEFTTRPGNANTFGSGIIGATIDGTTVGVQYSSSSSAHGIYLEVNGTLTRIIDQSIIRPDGSGNTFTQPTRPMLDSGVVAFKSAGSIWTDDGNQITSAVTAPSTDYSIVTPAQIDGQSILYQGVGPNFISPLGLYVNTAGQTETIVDDSTLFPGTATTFTTFPAYATASIDDGNVAFVGIGNVNDVTNYDGLFTTWGGLGLQPILTEGDTLDGKNIKEIRTSNESLSGNQVAFLVTFQDNSRAVYVADLQIVPEPTSLALLTLGGLGLVRRRR